VNQEKVGDEQTICLPIFGRKGTNFTAVYPLTPFGKYVQRIPTLRPNQ
jgi:hypothetical protein